MSDWRPTASAAALRQRAAMLRRVREFFAERGVVEVQTPLLTASGVTDVQIESIATAAPAGWLRTSPEYFHKRLLADGFGDLFELGPAFRRGECGRNHQPEFTLLEWYRVGMSWRELAGEAAALVRACLPGRELSIRFASWQESFEQRLGIDALEADMRTLSGLADGAPAGLDRDALLDWLFATRIQERFLPGEITVVHHYPASQAALARLDPDDLRVAKRFELFVGPIELANGYHELCDPIQQRSRFERDLALRRDRGQEPMPIDETLLDALGAGLPDCSGIALGFDRLLMLACDADTIEQVVSFARRPGLDS
ncbi:MAG: EF-P lysine aminoacylase GenX [Gammaproteobacteria bacterium]|jgi:lysyl-tRNA synthetase class 2|nr:EF-P lysine aminoacylase GenX [Gammaproteobacteria bacterium]